MVHFVSILISYALAGSQAYADLYQGMFENIFRAYDKTVFFGIETPRAFVH